MHHLPRPAQLYLLTFWATAALLVSGTLSTMRLDSLSPMLLVFLLLYALADYFEVTFEVRDGSTVILTIADAIALGLIGISGPGGILVVALGTAIAELLHRRVWYRVLFNVAHRCIVYILVMSIYQFISAPNAIPFTGLHGLAAFLAVALTYYLLNTFFISIIISLTSARPLLRVYASSFQKVHWVHLMVMPVGAIIAILWHTDHWLVLLGILPLVLAQRSFLAVAAWQKESQRSKELASKLEHLQKTATTMIATFKTEPILETVSTELAALLRASARWVVLLQRSIPQIVARDNLPSDIELNLPAIYAQLQAQTVHQLSGDALRLVLSPVPTHWQTLVLIPLVLERRVLGGIVLALDHTADLSDDDCRILSTFAAQATLALEHARLFSEVKEHQEELVRSAKLAALGTFAAGIAHEFNNLLGVILGYVQLGITSDTRDEKDEVLRQAERMCLRGKSITHGLLTFARHGPVQRRLHSLNAIVEETLMLVERDLVKHNITVMRQLTPTGPVFCDPGQITQVLVNLISNARDAMLEQGGGTITVTLDQREQCVELSVSDSGCGIPEELIEHIFQPFVTTKGAIGDSTIPGTGLGLSISYGIVESHHGTISVKSTVGRGTTLTIRLPSAPPDAVQKPKRARNYTLSVLVVDNDSARGDSLAATLEAQGCAVTVAHDRAVGLRRYREQAHDLVLSSAAIAGEDAEFVYRLRIINPHVTLLVIASSEQQAAALQTVGASTLLAEPFTADELFAAIDRSITPALVQAA